MSEAEMAQLLTILSNLVGVSPHFHCPYCCGAEYDYHTMCFYIDEPECEDNQE